MREQNKKDARNVRATGRTMSDGERQGAIKQLHSSIRPRLVFDKPLTTTYGSLCMSSSLPVIAPADVISTSQQFSASQSAMGLDCRAPSSGQVTINGVNGRAELNGRLADIVDSAPDASGRLTVRLSSVSGRDGQMVATTKLMRIRADCLSGDRAAQRSASTGALRSPTIKLQPLHSKYRGFRRGRGGAFFFTDGVE